MTTFALKVWKARNLIELDNSILVEWRVLGQKPQSAICGSDKCFKRLVRKLRKQGFVHISKVF